MNIQQNSEYVPVEPTLLQNKPMLSKKYMKGCVEMKAFEEWWEKNRDNYLYEGEDEFAEIDDTNAIRESWRAALEWVLELANAVDIDPDTWPPYLIEKELEDK